MTEEKKKNKGKKKPACPEGQTGSKNMKNLSIRDYTNQRT